VNLEGTGFFTKDSSNHGISQRATNTGGFLVGYRYHFNDWLAAEADYGYARDTQKYFTSTGFSRVQSNIHETTAAVVVTPPLSVMNLKPFLLAGSGALVFDPRNASIAGAQRQAKAAFVYGGGVDYDLTHHLALRARIPRVGIQDTRLQPCRIERRQSDAHSTTLRRNRHQILIGQREAAADRTKNPPPVCCSHLVLSRSFSRHL
jgi:opacity protein-like surface antigen